jgi:type IV pilus assembly protein PilV
MLMKRANFPRSARREQGTTMIEVLVSIIIVVVGLLGLAGLQSRAAVAEMEAFQRAQAIVLVQDMVDRINANRKASAAFITATPAGTPNAPADCSTLNGPPRDLCEWNNALLGAAESVGGLKVGAMIGARGCVTDLGTTMPRQYLVSVVWQGLAPTKAPGATSCGLGAYGDDATRRAITATVGIGCLQNDPATGTCIGP